MTGLTEGSAKNSQVQKIMSKSGRTEQQNMEQNKE
jgi:hypothetical protein